MNDECDGVFWANGGGDPFGCLLCDCTLVCDGIDEPDPPFCRDERLPLERERRRLMDDERRESNPDA